MYPDFRKISCNILKAIFVPRFSESLVSILLAKQRKKSGAVDAGFQSLSRYLICGKLSHQRSQKSRIQAKSRDCRFAPVY